MRFPMLISPLPGAKPCLPEHKIGVFVRFCQQEELNELDELDEQEELNEQDKLNELNEQEELNGRVSSVYKKKRVANVVPLLRFASLL